MSDDAIIRHDRRPPPKPIITTVLGVVVGDAATMPALCVVRYESRVIYAGDPLCGEPPIWSTDYVVLGMERLPAETPYPAVAARVDTLARRLYLRDARGDYHALVDASGVGRPVVSAIRDSIIDQCHVTAVTVANSDAGDDSLLWRTEATVGLTYLVSRLRAIVGSHRLRLPADPSSEALISQLQAHSADTASGPDLVRVLALACATEYTPLRYGPRFDSLPSARI